MAILCLEGPSAVGKTASAAALASAGEAYVIPEVNLLFDRPADEAPGWYFERQVDRWRMAVEQSGRHPLVVLDGDPFQPLWYSWAYDYAGWQDIDSLESFYRPRVVRGEIGFPDLYVVLGASVRALRERKAADTGRRRGGFEHHLRFIEPQRRYFRAMQAFSPERVRFLEPRDVEETARTVVDAARDARRETRPVELFDRMIGWLREHPESA